MEEFARARRCPDECAPVRSHGLEVAVAGPDDKVDLRHVTPGRNFGTEIDREGVGGLNAGLTYHHLHSESGFEATNTAGLGEFDVYKSVCRGLPAARSESLAAL